MNFTNEFKWKEITTPYKGQNTLARYPEKRAGAIILKGKKRISFGSGLNQTRIYYLLKSLQKMHFQFKQKGTINT